MGRTVRKRLMFFPAAFLALTLLAACNQTPEGPTEKAPDKENYKFLWRGSDVQDNQHFVVDEFSEGEYILDIKEVRWDAEEGAWTRRKDDVTKDQYSASPTNDKHLIWDEAVYAPADGKIISCWRNAPDNPVPGEKLPEVDGSDVPGTKTIALAGNHITIATTGGYAYLAAHLKQGSIPPELCPYNNTYMSDATDRMPSDCPDPDKSDVNGFPVETFIPEGSRPTIATGQFLGTAGNSGNSGGPHTHVHTRPLFGSDLCPSVAMHFYGVYRQDYISDMNADPAAWDLLSGEAVTETVGASLMHPAPEGGSPGPGGPGGVVGEQPPEPGSSARSPASPAAGAAPPVASPSKIACQLKAPEPLGPKDGDSVADDTPTLTWSATVEPRCPIESFDLQIGRDPRFGEVDHATAVPASVREHTFEQTLECGTWYWRIRSRQGRTASAWASADFVVRLRRCP